MKNLIFTCLSFLVLLCACGKLEDKRIRIAILTPVTHPSLEQIEKGLIETMEASHPGRYRFVVYNAQGNKMLMRSELGEIARQDYALVFTIGTSASQMASELIAKNELSQPVIFTAVNDPIGFHIVPSEQAPGGMITGVKEMLDFKEEINILLKLKPSVKSIVLVYNPTEPGLQKDQKELKKILKEKNISLTTVEVYNANEIQVKVSPFIEKADALLVLKDNTVVTGLDVLVKLCNNHRIPLAASDLDSPARGAAFGFGVEEIDFGTEAAKKALLVLEKGVSIGTIPVTPVSRFSLRINPEAAQKQGIILSEGDPS